MLDLEGYDSGTLVHSSWWRHFARLVSSHTLDVRRELRHGAYVMDLLDVGENGGLANAVECGMGGCDSTAKAAVDWADVGRELRHGAYVMDLLDVGENGGLANVVALGGVSWRCASLLRWTPYGDGRLL